MKTITLCGTLLQTQDNQRLDAALAHLFPDYSRSQLQAWIRQGYVQLDGKVIEKPRHIVRAFQKIIIHAHLSDNVVWAAQPIALTIIYEDDAIIVINKPVGLIVHPGAGNPDHTLVNALLHHYPELSTIPRAGIVHRLDKDTSGLLVIARTLSVHNWLIKQMQARNIEREYRAIAHGYLISGGTVNQPMGRHATQRTKMAVRDTGKEAITHYRVLEHFTAHTLLTVKLETGRTHQIRVHLAHIGYPLVGDATYGKKGVYQNHALSLAAQAALKNFNHQALHAYRLQLTHPITQETMEWVADVPVDFENLLTALRDVSDSGR